MTTNQDMSQLQLTVETAIDLFYQRRIEKLNSLNLWQVLKRKNPYLFQVYGFDTAQDIVESILSAFMSSSEETMFGQIFFEEVALIASGGHKSSADSIDVEVHDINTIKLYAVKSGTSVFNAQSRQRQEQAFQEAINRLRGQVKTVEPIIGYAYGTKKSRDSAKARNYKELAGKDFWYDITGNPNFYLELVDFIGTIPKKYAREYQKSYSAAVNRLSKELLDRFCNDEGLIDWKKLVKAVSG